MARARTFVFVRPVLLTLQLPPPSSVMNTPPVPPAPSTEGGVWIDGATGRERVSIGVGAVSLEPQLAPPAARGSLVRRSLPCDLLRRPAFVQAPPPAYVPA